MKLSENEKKLIDIKYQKKFIKSRKKFDQISNAFYPDFDESRILNLHKNNVERFTQKLLKAKVESFITVFKKRDTNRIPDDKDVESLKKDLSLIVKTQIRHFSEKYKGRFSISDSIVESHLQSLEYELPSKISEVIYLLGEYIQETKVSEFHAGRIRGDYDKALKNINNAMSSNNRVPIKLMNDDEDSYRRLLLHSLNGEFEGQANAEALNKRGKTDIKISRGNETIFIGECKIWGREKLCETVNQLLDYVNWHDKKAAIIIFSKNFSFEKVLSKIEEEIEKHDYYIRSEKGTDENFKCWFRHPEDINRELFLSILVFNIYISNKLKGEKL